MKKSVTPISILCLWCLALADPQFVSGQTKANNTTPAPGEYEPTSKTDAAASQFSLLRGLRRSDLAVKTNTVRLNSGKKVSLVQAHPKTAKSVPTILVMDIAAAALVEESSGGRKSRENRERRHAAYLYSSPLGTHLLSAGFGVAYVVADDLASMRTAGKQDWINLADRVRNNPKTAPNDFFLFATREYANLSISLASIYDFSAFALEEPGYPLFSRQAHQEVVKNSAKLSSSEIWKRTGLGQGERYLRIFSQIGAPVMIIRNPGSHAYDFNEKTLIAKLSEAQTYFETVEIAGPLRAHTHFGGQTEGVLEIAPSIGYYPETVVPWVNSIVGYFTVTAATSPAPLPRR